MTVSRRYWIALAFVVIAALGGFAGSKIKDAHDRHLAHERALTRAVQVTQLQRFAAVADATMGRFVAPTSWTARATLNCHPSAERRCFVSAVGLRHAITAGVAAARAAGISLGPVTCPVDPAQGFSGGQPVKLSLICRSVTSQDGAQWFLVDRPWASDHVGRVPPAERTEITLQVLG